MASPAESPTPAARPRVLGVLETVLYYSSEQEADVERFYRDLLGLRPISRWVGSGMAFRLGEGVLLLFDRADRARLETIAHGASGPVHACFIVTRGDYERWQDYLEQHGVAVIEEATWRNGIRSFYFRDPAGNLLEIADGDLWPR